MFSFSPVLFLVIGSARPTISPVNVPLLTNFDIVLNTSRLTIVYRRCHGPGPNILKFLWNKLCMYVHSLTCLSYCMFSNMHDTACSATGCIYMYVEIVCVKLFVNFNAPHWLDNIIHANDILYTIFHFHLNKYYLRIKWQPFFTIRGIYALLIKLFNNFVPSDLFRK